MLAAHPLRRRTSGRPGEPSLRSARRVVGMGDGPVGAYVHVPFCATICPFCPYNKVVARAGQPERYFGALRDEVRGYLEAGASGPRGFTSLYVGGGTPTLFPELLRGVVAEIPVTGERAIEVLPTHATPETLDDLRDMGFTAVSIGAQSFSDEVLHHLRRPHDAATARQAVAASVGRFELVDADLILDVEYDDAHAGSFLRDLVQCFELGVDQVSTYPLMRFGYTPFGSGAHNRRREHEVLADATRLAAAHGYRRRSVWTFNRPDSPTYSSITRRRFLGLGAGASSFLGRDFLVNHFGVETYITAVMSGRLPIARHFHLGEVGGAAYDAFWRAYSGRFCVPGFGCHPLSSRGFDRFHDLERWVTYHLIEPLWAEMLADHAAEGARATWAAPGRARTGRLWSVATRVMERPV